MVWYSIAKESSENPRPNTVWAWFEAGGCRRVEFRNFMLALSSTYASTSSSQSKGTQGFQKPLSKKCALNRLGVLAMDSGIFLTQGLLEALGMASGCSGLGRPGQWVSGLCEDLELLGPGIKRGFPKTRASIGYMVYDLIG